MMDMDGNSHGKTRKAQGKGVKDQDEDAIDEFDFFNELFNIDMDNDENMEETKGEEEVKQEGPGE